MALTVFGIKKHERWISLLKAGDRGHSEWMPRPGLWAATSSATSCPSQARSQTSQQRHGMRVIDVASKCEKVSLSVLTVPWDCGPGSSVRAECTGSGLSAGTVLKTLMDFLSKFSQ